MLGEQAMLSVCKRCTLAVAASAEMEREAWPVLLRWRELHPLVHPLFGQICRNLMWHTVAACANVDHGQTLQSTLQQRTD
jgi:hypothetical protein